MRFKQKWPVILPGLALENLSRIILGPLCLLHWRQSRCFQKRLKGSWVLHKHGKPINLTIRNTCWNHWSVKLLRLRYWSVTLAGITTTCGLCNHTENLVLKLYFIYLNHLLDCCNNSEFRDCEVSYSCLLTEDSTHGHHQMVNTEIRLIIFFAAKEGEALYSQQKQDQELTVDQTMNSLLSNSDLNWRK